MSKNFIFVLCVVPFVIFVDSANYRKQSESRKVWSEDCTSNSHILNDCNWCTCGPNKQFVCSARPCSTVDKFGHFNDAIQDIDVGMEGHGVWRSTKELCAPGVRYTRGSLLCICKEDGNWPSPVCRDTFLVMHPIQVLSDSAKTCEPRTLFLNQCNACICPDDGSLNTTMCTNKSCEKDDPVLRKIDSITENEDTEEIYVECKADEHYQLGCRSCVCLRNNRLICDKCNTESKKDASPSFYCSNKRPNEVFNIKCNLCFCDESNVMYCSVRRCLSENNIYSGLPSQIDTNLRTTEPPVDDKDCVPGTVYKRDCNTCRCTELLGKKVVSCTMKACREIVKRSVIEKLLGDCVVGTTYDSNCHTCSCEAHGGEKRQVCIIKPTCSKYPSQYKYQSSIDLNYKRGYCEPLHYYNDGCNACQCLTNGQSVQCTSNICRKSKPAGAIDVDLVPVLESGSKCPKGHSYKVDCNVCFCLSNGNALCTMTHCDNKTKH